MLKLVLFPFVAIFSILRVIFFPWYLRWIFTLPSLVFIALASVVGFFALTAFETYETKVAAAQQRANASPPALTPLSQWDRSDVGDFDEINVEGIYFTALPRRSFGFNGATDGFILLADDLGREIKAALVVSVDDLPRLHTQLAAQGSGEAINVEVNGTFSRNRDWERAVASELAILNLPAAQDLVVIEPFLGGRGTALMRDADSAYDEVAALGVLAAILASLGIGKFALNSNGSQRSSAHQSQRSARNVKAAKDAMKRANQTQAPAPSQSASSPWGETASGSGRVKPQTQDQKALALQALAQETPSQQKPRSPSRKAETPRETAQIDDAPLIPEFKSVFPHGGSAFRFKSADQIIRQSFGVRVSRHTLKLDD